ncbi:Mevalonate kinase [Agyrium rufum]|nr:Mevalonate kinase [Agyrium rufum]
MATSKSNGTMRNGIPGGRHIPVRHPAHERKGSSPMAPAFMTSAPGKVIVFGEHAVVHGKAAMAASISLRSYLLVTTLSKSKRTITLRFPDVGLDHTWDIDELPWDIFSHPDKKKNYYDLVTTLNEDLVAAIQPYLDVVAPSTPPEQRKVLQSAAKSFLYLFLSLASQSFPGSIYTLRSTLPIGAGLGSSASISVCLSSALLLQIHALAGPHPDQPMDESKTQIERINRWAFVGELCIHGNPSGVDNTVASGGKAVLFKRVDYNAPPKVTPLWHFPELPLLLINTKQPRSTAVEVAKVAQLKESQPEISNLILEAIDKVTEAANELAESMEGADLDPETLETLGKLMDVNHGLLVALGVSHPKIERIRELVGTHKIGWTKLTGAGGGGCTITLLSPDSQPSDMLKLESRIEAEGFEKFEATLGGDGVGVLWPAVLKNGTDELGGEEIDQEKFLRAEGRDGVEALVGVGGQERREGWKFWR